VESNDVPSNVPSTTAVPEKWGAGFCTRTLGVYAAITDCGLQTEGPSMVRYEDGMVALVAVLGGRLEGERGWLMADG
jgi:hypothetical protein